MGGYRHPGRRHPGADAILIWNWGRLDPIGRPPVPARALSVIWLVASVEMGLRPLGGGPRYCAMMERWFPPRLGPPRRATLLRKGNAAPQAAAPPLMAPDHQSKGVDQMATATQATCPECGKSFRQWRAKKFCSDRCRKRVENRRLRAEIADGPKNEKIIEENQSDDVAVRGDEGPAFKVRNSAWVAVNDVTDKLQYRGTALGYTMMIEGRGWFGRVHDDRGDWSFGPSTRSRVRQAVESWIRHEPFEKREGEATWAGDCMRMLGQEVAR